ncbi:hypothetical protein [Streptomyces sp. NPDC002540]
MRLPAFPEDLIATQCAWARTVRTYRTLVDLAALALPLPDGQVLSGGERVARGNEDGIRAAHRRIYLP